MMPEITPLIDAYFQRASMGYWWQDDGFGNMVYVPADTDNFVLSFIEEDLH